MICSRSTESRSKFRERKFEKIERPLPWVAKIGVFLVEFSVAAVWTSYCLHFLQILITEERNPKYHEFLPLVVYFSFQKITGPWIEVESKHMLFRRLAQSKKNPDLSNDPQTNKKLREENIITHKIMIGYYCTVIFFLALLIPFSNYVVHNVILGMLGFFGSGVMVHTRYLCKEMFKDQFPNTEYDFIAQIARSSSMCVTFLFLKTCNDMLVYNMAKTRMSLAPWTAHSIVGFLLIGTAKRWKEQRRPEADVSVKGLSENKISPSRSQSSMRPQPDVSVPGPSARKTSPSISQLAPIVSSKRLESGVLIHGPSERKTSPSISSSALTKTSKRPEPNVQGSSGSETFLSPSQSPLPESPKRPESSVFTQGSSGSETFYSPSQSPLAQSHKRPKSESMTEPSSELVPSETPNEATRFHQAPLASMESLGLGSQTFSSSATSKKSPRKFSLGATRGPQKRTPSPRNENLIQQIQEIPLVEVTEPSSEHETGSQQLPSKIDPNLLHIKPKSRRRKSSPQMVCEDFEIENPEYNEKLLKELVETLKNCYFFPPLLSTTAVNLVFALLLLNCPHFFFKLFNANPLSDFSILMLGVPWFLTSFQVGGGKTHGNYKAYMAGLLILAIAINFMIFFDNLVVQTIAWITFGFGYGITACLEKAMHKFFFRDSKSFIEDPDMLLLNFDFCIGWLLLVCFFVSWIFYYYDVPKLEWIQAVACFVPIIVWWLAKFVRDLQDAGKKTPEISRRRLLNV